MFTIFPRADLIRKLGIAAAFSMERYQPENQIIQAFRRAYGERPTSPVHNAMQLPWPSWQAPAGSQTQQTLAGHFAGGTVVTLLGRR